MKIKNYLIFFVNPKQISTVLFVLSSLLSSNLEAANEASPCAGVTIQIVAHARESSISEVLTDIKAHHPRVNVRPITRNPNRTSAAEASSAVAEYSSHAEYRCAKALMELTKAEETQATLNQRLPSASLMLTWQEKSPVLFGANPKLGLLRNQSFEHLP